MSIKCYFLLSQSPFSQINNIRYTTPSLIFKDSFFSHSFSAIISSYSNNHIISIENSIFQNTLNSAILLGQDESASSFESHCFLKKNYKFKKTSKGQIIFKNIQIKDTDFQSSWSDHRSFFVKKNSYTCGNIAIVSCVFKNCYSSNLDGGGGIYIEQDCSVIFHEILFDACHTNDFGGGALICKKRNRIKNGDFHDEQIKDANIQYVCFQNCYGNKKDIIFGTALFIASVKIILYYSSTNNCGTKVRSAGAQYDVQTKDVTSQFINLTGGSALYSSSIEYRYATKGFFKFQTIKNLNSRFITSFSSVQINGMAISYCNIVSNKISNTYSDSDPPAVIYVRYKPITIENFYFVKNTFPDGIGVYATRLPTDTITITMKNCYSDDGNSNRYPSYLKKNNCKFGNTKFTTYKMSLLKLGNCKGIKTAGYLIITSFFTPSIAFTSSDVFTQSNTFSVSNFFSYSDYFTKSEKFTISDDFSHSNYFTNSRLFSFSQKFSFSYYFSNSLEFTNTKYFSKSNSFTMTYFFSKSTFFSHSNDFTKSLIFSNTKIFTKSSFFTESSVFTYTKIFSYSNEFSKSLFFSLWNKNIFYSNGPGKKKKPKIIIICLIGIACLILFFIFLFLIIFFIKRKKDKDESANEINQFSDQKKSYNNSNMEISGKSKNIINSEDSDVDIKFWL